jgi:hypothetical protein
MSATATATAVLTPQLLGRAENLHRAGLTRTLAGTGLDYPGWVALKLASGAAPAPRTELAARIVAASRIEPDRIEAALDRLLAADLLRQQDTLSLTPAGAELVRTLTATVTGNVERIYGSVPAEDLATAGRVLTAINAAFEAELGLA